MYVGLGEGVDSFLTDDWSKTQARHCDISKNVLIGNVIQPKQNYETRDKVQKNEEIVEKEKHMTTMITCKYNKISYYA